MARTEGDEQERLLKAISHPLRHRVLVAIDEAGEASPKEVADALEESLGRVSHHVRVLANLGVIELTRTQPRRGATEHFYRAAVKAWFDDAAWADLPRATRSALVRVPLGRLMHDMRHAVHAGGFDHPRVHVSYVLLELDDRGMDAVAEVLGEALQRITAIKDDPERRLEETDRPLRTELGIVHFER